MKIAIVGSRDYPNEKQVREFVQALSVNTAVISGGARGVDSWALNEAMNRNLEVLVFPANWEKHGKAAGMIRNRDIVKTANVVVAFWDGKSRGTANTIALAIEANKLLAVFIA